MCFQVAQNKNHQTTHRSFRRTSCPQLSSMASTFMTGGGPHVSSAGGYQQVAAAPMGAGPTTGNYYPAPPNAGGGYQSGAPLSYGADTPHIIMVAGAPEEDSSCAQAGCIFSWIPIVGFINFCSNNSAPVDSKRRRLANISCAIASVVRLGGAPRRIRGHCSKTD